MSGRDGTYSRRVKWLVRTLVSVMTSFVAFQTCAEAYTANDGHLREVSFSILPPTTSTVPSPRPTPSRHDGKEDDVSNTRRSRRSTTSPRDPQSVVDELNNIRRSVMASNMYYVSLDTNLLRYAAQLVQSCELQTQFAVDPPTPNTNIRIFRGITGFINPSTGIGDELRNVFYDKQSDERNPFYAQIMTSYMVAVGCQIGSTLCTYDDDSSLPAPTMSEVQRRGPQTQRPRGERDHQPGRPERTSHKPSQHAYVFACLFGYTRPLDTQNLYTKSGINCSNCDTDAALCDRGLCRLPCSPNVDPTCDNRCQQACSDCGTATDYPECACLCYYSNGQSRCRDAGGASSTQPICVPPPPPRRAISPSAWLTMVVIASVLLLVILCLLSCCVHRRYRSRSRSSNERPTAEPRQSSHRCTAAVTPVSDGASSATDPIAYIMAPPSYDFLANADFDPSLKPPPYSSAVQYISNPPAYGDDTSTDASDRQLTATAQALSPQQSPSTSASAPDLSASVTMVPSSAPNEYTIRNLPQPLRTTDEPVDDRTILSNSEPSIVDHGGVGER